MIKNYFKIAWRSLSRSKTISIISIAGLALGIACFLLLDTYILNELRYDRFHLKADQIMRVNYSYKTADDPEPVNTEVTPTAVVPVFKRAFSEIEDGVRVYDYAYKPVSIQFKDKNFNEKSFLLADASFFKIFSFNFLSGNPATALSNPNNVVITASTSKKYFGEENPLGKTLNIDSKPWQISGVIADVPPYSQLKFDFLGSYSTLEDSKTEKWNSANDVSYFLLKSAGQQQSLQNKINAYVKNQFADDFKSGRKTWFELEPLKQVHLYSKAATGNIKYIYILSAISILLLLIACINFINLITAKSSERAHEIGVRKVLGAERKQVFLQFIAESGIVTMIAILIGLVIARLALPYFNLFTGLSLSIKTWNGGWLISTLGILFLLITFIAGTWPALVLSAFQPVKVLKGAINRSSSGGNLRKSLVVFQFTISIAFIIATLIAGRQLYFIQHINTGIDRSQVLVLDAGISNEKLEPLKNELLKISSVKSVTASYDSPVNVKGGYTLNAQEKSPDFSLSITAIPVDQDFISALGIKILQGSNFTNMDVLQVLTKDDEKRRYAFMLNKTAVAAMGWTPEQAIGKQVNLNGRKGEVKAVLEDFNFASLHQKIAPIIVFAEYNWFSKILIKVSEKDVKNSITGAEKAWKSVFKKTPFQYHFLDQEYEELYKTEQRTAGILNIFSVITILISCLGLFGLAVFMAEQRTKEIGIRKVLGASITNIVALLSVDFLKLVVFAFIIAAPFSWLFMNKWLQDFAYKINISWWIFALAGLLAIVIALATVSFQAVKAALANPVKSLRSE